MFPKLFRNAHAGQSQQCADAGVLFFQSLLCEGVTHKIPSAQVFCRRTLPVSHLLHACLRSAGKINATLCIMCVNHIPAHSVGDVVTCYNSDGCISLYINVRIFFSPGRLAGVNYTSQRRSKKMKI